MKSLFVVCAAAFSVFVCNIEESCGCFGPHGQVGPVRRQDVPQPQPVQEPRVEPRPQWSPVRPSPQRVEPYPERASGNRAPEQITETVESVESSEESTEKSMERSFEKSKERSFEKSKEKSAEKEIARDEAEEYDTGGTYPRGPQWPVPGNWPSRGGYNPPQADVPGAGGFPGPLGGGRNAQEAALGANDALLQILMNMNGGDMSKIPYEVLDEIPPSTLAQMPPDVLASLPRGILAKLPVGANANSQVLVQMLQYMPVDRVASLPWESISQALPASGYNQLSPTVLGAIPWQRTLPTTPKDIIGGMSLQTIQFIPQDAWAGIPFESLQAIKPKNLCSMPLNSLKSIPPGHLKRMGCGRLNACSKDVLNAVNPELLQSALDCGIDFSGRETLAEMEGRAASTFEGGDYANDKSRSREKSGEKSRENYSAFRRLARRQRRFRFRNRQRA